MLSSNVREILTGVEAVIVDEIHAVAQTKRGSHLALTLERLESVGEGRAGEESRGQTAGRARRLLPRLPPDPADRALRDAAAAGADRAVPGRAEAGVPDRRCGAEEGAGPGDRGAGRGHGRPGGARLSERGRAAADRNRAQRPRPLDLAGDLPQAPGAGPGTHLDDHLRQQPPRRRAPGQAAERARERRRRSRSCPATEHAGAPRGGEPSTGEGPSQDPRPLRRDRPCPPRLALPRGADASSRSCSSPASCPASSRPAPWSWASTWAPSTW